MTEHPISPKPASYSGPAPALRHYRGWTLIPAGDHYYLQTPTQATVWRQQLGDTPAKPLLFTWPEATAFIDGALEQADADRKAAR